MIQDVQQKKLDEIPDENRTKNSKKKRKKKKKKVDKTLVNDKQAEMELKVSTETANSSIKEFISLKELIFEKKNGSQGSKANLSKNDKQAERNGKNQEIELKKTKKKTQKTKEKEKIKVVTKEKKSSPEDIANEVIKKRGLKVSNRSKLNENSNKKQRIQPNTNEKQIGVYDTCIGNIRMESPSIRLKLLKKYFPLKNLQKFDEHLATHIFADPELDRELGIRDFYLTASSTLHKVVCKLKAVND